MAFPPGETKYFESMMARMTPGGRLCVAVLNRAALDWRMLIRKKAWKREAEAKTNFAELRQFFNSAHCARLCSCCEDLTPERMLQLLERELREAMELDEREDRDRTRRETRGAALEHICELCRHPYYATSREELERLCGRCRVEQLLDAAIEAAGKKESR